MTARTTSPPSARLAAQLSAPVPPPQRWMHTAGQRLLPPALCMALCSLPCAIWADAPSPEATTEQILPTTATPAAAATKPVPKPAARRKVSQAGTPSKPLPGDPETALRLRTEREIRLPGVMVIPGESPWAPDPLRTQVVAMGRGSNAVVYLSSETDNRIELPFANPFIRHNSDITVEVNKGASGLPGNFVYLGFAVKRASQIFIEPPDGSASLGLRLVPRDIPSQSVVVEDLLGQSTADLRQANRSNEYLTRVQSTMEVLAKQGIPQGYAAIDLDLPVIAMHGLLVQTQQKLSSRETDLYVYQVSNPGPGEALLSEAEFDGEQVLAVSIFPKPRIAPGHSVQVLVMAGKPLPPSPPRAPD